MRITALHDTRACRHIRYKYNARTHGGITIDSTARIIAMSALNIEEIEASIKSSSINIENLKHKLDELEALKKEESELKRKFDDMMANTAETTDSAATADSEKTNKRWQPMKNVS